MLLRKHRYGTLLGRLSLDCMQAKDSSQMMQEFASRKPRVNPFLKAYHEDFAARADWCVKGYDECNHNPVVTVSAPDLYAKPGETVTLRARNEHENPMTGYGQTIVHVC